MLIGVPKETKDHEYRVGLTPASVRELVHHGHAVVIETNAGDIIGLRDDDYVRAGAAIADSADQVFATAEMIVKVKEPSADEAAQLRTGQVLFTYLHLAPLPDLTRALVETDCIAIAYETVTDAHGGLPLLAPMSEVAGRMSIQAGAHALEIEQGGRGMLLGGVPGTLPAKVTVLGGGVVGTNAARVALGMEADVKILDIDLHRLANIDLHLGPGVNTVYSTVDAVHESVVEADLVIGAVLVPGSSAPKLVSEAMVRDMKRGSVLVDVAIDQGGCFETSRPTTHSNPTFTIDGVVHYCVTNMPGAVARTSTFALNNATLPFVVAIANQGPAAAVTANEHLAKGVNIWRGNITYEAVAATAAANYVPLSSILAV